MNKYILTLIITAAILLTAAAPARSAEYELAKGPFTIEDLGPLLNSTTQDQGQVMFQLSGGEKHLLMFYVTENMKHPNQLVDLNLETGAAVLRDGVLGRPGARVLHPNDKIYLVGSDVYPKAPVLEYDPKTTVSRKVAETSVYKGDQCGVVGDDQAIYFGSCCWGETFSYNPATSTLAEYGRMDDNIVGLVYVYTIGADARYIYGGLRDISSDWWYLGVYDRQTQERQLFFKEFHDNMGIVYKGKNGGWYYERYNATPGYHRWYRLEQGGPVEIPSAPQVVPTYEAGGVNRETATFPAAFGYEFNLENIYPDDFNNQATIMWRAVGEEPWRSAQVTGFDIQPVTIKRLYSSSGDKLLAASSFYGPIFTYDTAEKTKCLIGRPLMSLYDILLDTREMYLSGYTAITLRYDPEKPWTLSSTTPDKGSPEVNPHRAARFGTYHYYSAKGADGLIYIGVYHLRDALTGGSIGWYDPSTGATGSLHAPFADYSIRDLKAVLGGTKLVYSSNKNKLFVFDVAKKELDFAQGISIPDVESLDKIIEVEPGIIMGASGAKLYKVDVRSGEVLFVHGLPGEAFGGTSILAYDRRLDHSPDGYVWMFIGNAIYRIDPDDRERQKIIDAPAANILFKGTDLYLYGGKNLKRIRGIFVRAGDISADGSITAYDAALALQLGNDVLEAAKIAQIAVGLL